MQNGICTCTATGSQQFGGDCSCPNGAQITQNYCECVVPGTTLQNNKCVCTGDFKHYTARWNGGNFYCVQYQMCCSMNEQGPSFSCSGSRSETYMGCPQQQDYVTKKFDV
ncbi:Hypothetical_protein [Hexamita inflata]|uniref:Hypothetical_protein n=1 Tax=Hexamita inflata TaxID=28002 RepID=A0AA86R6F7_9EUKA|nr:Hypothetical protein HINF_LOCUS54459 [Hexamita inflata]